MRIKEEEVGGPGIATSGTPLNPSNRDINSTSISGQGLKGWHGTEHPFWELWELIEQAQCLLIRRRKNPASEFIKRIIHLLPYFERQIVGSGGRLVPIARQLKKAMWALNANEADLLLDEAKYRVGDIIVADEDAKFPGCRNEDGELVLGGRDE